MGGHDATGYWQKNGKEQNSEERKMEQAKFVPLNPLQLLYVWTVT